MDSAAGGFPDTERFVLEGRLGEGGMGVVYRARDRELGRMVALKTMTHVDPGSLLRFKKEFRALADIMHPHVVDLYELISAGEQWFFTMELVDGVDFLTWVQESAPRSSQRNDQHSLVRRLTTRGAVAPTLDASTLPEGVLPERPASSRGALSCCVDQPERLRAALRQLTEGVIAIHAAGKLHRDIKPSNVLVTRGGRVVLLDFGVVGDYVPGRSGDPAEDSLLGTPAYMAPEQAGQGCTLPASDFYAIGTMLFEVLTDDLPFVGTPREILTQKRELDPPAPSARVAGVPPDMDELCVDLLSRDPARRPDGEEILRRLGKGGRAHSVITVTGAQGSFVGRRAQLDELDRALASSREGRPVVVFVNGRSGMGKTALVQHYFERLRADPDVLLLAGRCYERESVPFKGLDSVVDELSRFLMRLPDAHAAALVPEGIEELSRVFPVLRSVRAVQAQPPPEYAVVEPREVRRRAFTSLKRLLSALTSQWSVVVHIDDLQWSDVDSVALIRELLAPPDPPPVLLVCGYRDELAADSAAVQELLAGMQGFEESGTLRRVAVERLSEAEAIELAQSSVETGPSPPPELLRAIARESHGVPFFVAELVRWQAAESGRTALERGNPISLEQVITARVEALPAAPRKLLSLLAVAGGPVEHELAGRAAGIGAVDRVAVNVLRSQRLARSYSHLDRDQVDTFHARVRETVMALLDPDERSKLHLSLADTLERSGTADPEALLQHFLFAGERERARRYAVPAARAAANSLAFLRAARLYQQAIELEADKPYRLYGKLADALANAGRSANAAEAYLAGASTAPSEEAIEMQRLAAEHFLKSGREQQGLVLLKAVLAEVGLSFPRSTAAALASLLMERARLAIRGRDPERVVRRGSPGDLLKVDVAFSATVGLSMFDLVRGAHFSARHLRLALSAGEPVRLGRALALEAANAVAVGDGSRERSERHVRRAEELATRIDDFHGMALAKLTTGLVRFFVGEWRSANKALDEATALLRERCSAVAWELANAEAWSCNSLILMGELAETSRRVPAFIKEAREREDRYALVNIIYAACITHMVADDVDAAWHVTTEEGGFYTPSGFTAGHWGAMVSAISVHRYRGQGRLALERVQRDWKPLERSQLLRVNVVRLTSLFERGLCAVAAYGHADSASDPLREADHYVGRLRRERLRFAPPLGEHLAACVAAARGDAESAKRALSRAIAGYERADMGYLESCARYRHGQLLGGDEGAKLVAQADSELEAQGVKNVEGCLAMSAPGFSRWVRRS
jgi:serine/threonine protein kinase